MYSGVDFETLCCGTVQHYSFNLADLGSENTVESIEMKLVKQLDDTVEALESGTGRKISHIYIGKTYIRENKEHQILDLLDPETWISHGIGQCWGFHRRRDCRDGLVVLGVFTEESVPESCRDLVHQEDFAVAFQQKLLHHYLLSHPDPRVVNDGFNSGYNLQRCQEAYALYMAFSYDDGYDSSSGRSLQAPARPRMLQQLCPVNIARNAGNRQTIITRRLCTSYGTEAPPSLPSLSFRPKSACGQRDIHYRQNNKTSLHSIRHLHSL